MADREKIIKEFEHLLNAAKGNYLDFVDLTVDDGEEILTLLKEQEAVEPSKDIVGNKRCPTANGVLAAETSDNYTVAEVRVNNGKFQLYAPVANIAHFGISDHLQARK